MTGRRDRAVAVPEPISEAQFARVRDLIEDRCGLDFGDGRRLALQGALATRMAQRGIACLDAYFERLQAEADDSEFRSLINVVTINETCFFRDPAQFRMLRRHVLPAVLADRAAAGSRTLRIWSAGCSSGEEAYSVALTLMEMGLPISHRDWTFEIVGTDVNTRVLDAARRGIYSERAVRNVEGDCLRHHFSPAGRHYQLAGDVMASVRFEHGSLTQDGPFLPRRYDIILCKNVAIYFRPEVTRRLVRRLHGALNTGGYLLLGHSESLWQMEEGFSLVEHDGVFCYRKPAPPAPPRVLTPVPRRVVAAEPPAAESPAGDYERCLAAFRAGDWKSADAEVRALLHASPSFVPAQLLLGGLHAHLGQYAEARAQAERVLRLNDLEPKAHLLLGMVAARAGRQDEAIEALRRALYLDDSLALAYFWLGNLYRDRGDFGRASFEHAAAVTRYERHQLDFTEEFAADLGPAQIVDFCRRSVERLRCGQ